MEKEVTVETSRVESETVRFCDMCGSPESHVERLEQLWHQDKGKPRIESDWLEAELDTYRHMNRTGEVYAVSSESLKKAWWEGRESVMDDAIDVCEACLEREFNAEAIEPLLLGEPDENATEAPEFDRLSFDVGMSVGFLVGSVIWGLGMLVLYLL